jgi:hypothetical protein
MHCTFWPTLRVESPEYVRTSCDYLLWSLLILLSIRLAHSQTQSQISCSLRCDSQEGVHCLSQNGHWIVHKTPVQMAYKADCTSSQLRKEATDVLETYVPKSEMATANVAIEPKASRPDLWRAIIHQSSSTTGLGLVVRTHGPQWGGCEFHSPCRRGAHHHSPPNYDGGSLDLVVWVPQSPLGGYHVRYFQGTSG